MEIRIKKPLAFSEIGRKDNQEDSTYPLTGNMSESDRLFVLCDGMGGHENGEVASRIVCDAIGYYFENHMQQEGMTVKDYFLSALNYAYDRLDEEDTGGERKMGTTMTSVYLHSSGVLVAHIGDSRIYQIRPSLYDSKSGRLGIVYQSEDHSLINDLLKIGEITPEEAENFPRKNVITRAMQPNQERRAKADVFSFDDVKPGDYFFLEAEASGTDMTGYIRVEAAFYDAAGKRLQNHSFFMISTTKKFYYEKFKFVIPDGVASITLQAYNRNGKGTARFRNIRLTKLNTKNIFAENYFIRDDLSTRISWRTSGPEREPAKVTFKTPGMKDVVITEKHSGAANHSVILPAGIIPGGKTVTAEISCGNVKKSVNFISGAVKRIAKSKPFSINSEFRLKVPLMPYLFSSCTKRTSWVTPSS